MLSQKLTDEINDQIMYEFYSAHLYLAAAAYCYDQDLDGFANFFTVQAEEERFHAMRFFNFVNDMDARIVVKGYETPPAAYADLVDLFAKTLEHEHFVTDRIYKLMDIATEEREHATISFLKWFVDEQVEEMATFKGLLTKLKRAAGDTSVIYDLDGELAARTFTPPTIV
ncbi:ferritin [Anaerotalea alkaliphila]|uniref:Ferritin n=1 Tax=Anaerotalea alkaliphila TaxID=2662126 RepID=A0A7X5HVY5_9FIRM|nr:ferritin [Anaerotalea alkaliphila]NDL67629.1 ferritin [Anaerotalea alkaliphila]